MIVYTLLYGALAVIEVKLLPALRPQWRRALRGAADPAEPGRGRPARLRLLRRIELQWTHHLLVHRHRRPLDRLPRPRGLRLRRRHAAARARRQGLRLDAVDAEKRRRVLLNTIGPVWDGNEVWLLTAGGATFAAFPDWYATMFSGFYLPLLLILVALIVRNLGFEYRRKRHEAHWRRAGTGRSSRARSLPALLWGVALTNIVRGVPINADKEYVGNLFTLLNPHGLLGGLVIARPLPHARRVLRRAQDRRQDPVTRRAGSPSASGSSPRCSPSSCSSGSASPTAAPPRG